MKRLARPAGFEPATLGLEVTEHPCWPLSYRVTSCCYDGPVSLAGIPLESSLITLNIRVSGHIIRHIVETPRYTHTDPGAYVLTHMRTASTGGEGNSDSKCKGMTLPTKRMG